MKSRTLHFALHAALACVVSAILLPLFAQEDGIYWFDDYGKAMEEAKRTGKPIFLEYRCEP